MFTIFPPENLSERTEFFENLNAWAAKTLLTIYHYPIKVAWILLDILLVVLLVKGFLKHRDRWVPALLLISAVICSIYLFMPSGNHTLVLKYVYVFTFTFMALVLIAGPLYLGKHPKAESLLVYFFGVLVGLDAMFSPLHEQEMKLISSDNYIYYSYVVAACMVICLICTFVFLIKRITPGPLYLLFLLLEKLFH